MSLNTLDRTPRNTQNAPVPSGLMNKALFYTILSLTLGLSLPSCNKEDESSAASPGAASPEQEKKAVSIEDVVVAAAKADEKSTLPSDAEIRNRILPELAAFPSIRLEQILVDAAPAAADGTTRLAARLRIRVAENLYSCEQAPEIFNEERRAINDSLNRAMQPEVSYLLQVGATTEEITEEDRKARPLPEELQELANAIRTLAEQPIYHLRTPAGTQLDIPATITARPEGSHWDLSDLTLDTAPLRALVSYLPEGGLPQGAAIVSQGFEEQQRAAIREQITAFNQAAEPTIRAREDAARTRVLELRSRREEEAKAAAEAAAIKTAAHEAWEKAAPKAFTQGSSYTGEWKRGEAFGKMSLRITQTQVMPDSLQFVGTISDPDLTQVELQIIGRCEPAARADEPFPVIVRIYHGRYNPDLPTAEAFDAKDALLKLTLSAADSRLSGVLTCAAWADSPEKAFEVLLTPAPKSRRAK